MTNIDDEIRVVELEERARKIDKSFDIFGKIIGGVGLYFLGKWIDAHQDNPLYQQLKPDLTEMNNSYSLFVSNNKSRSQKMIEQNVAGLPTLKGGQPLDFLFGHPTTTLPMIAAQLPLMQDVVRSVQDELLYDRGAIPAEEMAKRHDDRLNSVVGIFKGQGKPTSAAPTTAQPPGVATPATPPPGVPGQPSARPGETKGSKYFQ